MRLLQWNGLSFPNPSRVRVKHRILRQWQRKTMIFWIWFTTRCWSPFRRSQDGTFTQFNERHKEAWLCNEYDYRDTRRVPWQIMVFECLYKRSLKPLNARIYPGPIPVSIQKWRCISWCPMIPMIGGTSACAHRAEALSNAGGLILLKKLLGLCCL